MSGPLSRRAFAAIGSQPSFTTAISGDLATIGRRAAVVNLKHLELTGFLGWLFWSFVHIYFLIGVRSRFAVAFNWAWQYVTFQRGARLITGVDGECQNPPRNRASSSSDPGSYAHSGQFHGTDPKTSLLAPREGADGELQPSVMTISPSQSGVEAASNLTWRNQHACSED